MTNIAHVVRWQYDSTLRSVYVLSSVFNEVLNLIGELVDVQFTF